MAIASTLYFVRHGETDWNREGRMQGSRDIPLNELGRVQAEAVAPLLATVDPAVRTFSFVSSPQTRARATMMLVREKLGLPPETYAVDDRLRERSWGDWEGRTLQEVKLANPEATRAYKADRWNDPPPGGESYAMLSERISGWLSTLREPTVVVSHAGVARALLGLLTAMSKDELPTLAIPQGRVLVFAPDGYRLV